MRLGSRRRGSGGGVSVTSALQGDVAGEFAGLGAVTVDSADIIPLEDASAGNAKGRTTAGAIAALAGTSGALQWIDTITVAGAAATSVTFSNAGNGSQLWDINGNTDEIYVCFYEIIQAVAGTCTFTLKPNNLATNQDVEVAGSVAGVGLAAEVTVFHLGGGVTDSEGSSGWFFFFAKDNDVPRYYQSQHSVYQTAPGNLTNSHTTRGGLWFDTTNNVTSLVILSSIASGIGIGSKLKLFRLRAV